MATSEANVGLNSKKYIFELRLIPDWLQVLGEKARQENRPPQTESRARVPTAT